MTGDLIEVVVTRRVLAATDIMNFELRRPDNGALPAFTAGSHIDLHLPNGLVRQYSLCNSSSHSGYYEIAVLLEPDGRGGSKSAHEDLLPGSIVRITAPRNLFALVPGRHSILLAGGIGVTPILSMADALTSADASFEFHYCTRSEDRAAFRERIASSPFASRVRFHFDDGDSRQKLQIRDVLSEARDDVHLYVCGPTGFMDYVLSNARECGWSEANTHIEFFTAQEMSRTGDAGFDLKLARSGRIIRVEADQTVIKALALRGIDIPVSCEQGICGTCLTEVLEGEVEHRDQFLTEEEHTSNKLFTPCCSRAKSPMLVIDV
ncbi:PDR/VanB family oxidoreductase [Ensifer canadensis]|uniref:PDR/VanB family oxidoreductase n=1 Tax=Ensifer canadensis TaxID=555315 RepID=UPI001AEE072B